MTRFRFSNAAKAKILILLLAGTTFLTSCATNTSNISLSETSSGYHETQNAESKNEAKKIESLDQIHPTYTFKKWAGEPYLTIDEKSLEQIITLAMQDAEEFYLGIGSYNMKYDSKLNRIDTPGNFYTDWMTPSFFKARAKQEGSEIFMINYRANLNQNLYKDPCGVMQVNASELVPTLEEYFQNIYGISIDFDNLEIFPNKHDIANIESKQAQKNITQTVYNNVYLSVCYDIYQAKCLHPGHTDYYASYGGYSEDIRRQATIAAYLFGTDVVSSLKKGTFFEKYSNTDYVQNITRFQKEFEAQKKSAEIEYQN